MDVLSPVNLLSIYTHIAGDNTCSLIWMSCETMGRAAEIYFKMSLKTKNRREKRSKYHNQVVSFIGYFILQNFFLYHVTRYGWIPKIGNYHI